MIPKTKWEPGIYPGTSMETYIAIDAVNASSLKWAKVSMKHVKAALDGRITFSSTATEFGTLAHQVVLEPGTLWDRYIKEPPKEEFPDSKGKVTDSYRNTSAYKEWRKSLTRKLVTADDLLRANACLEAVRENPEANEMLTEDGEFECVIVWEDPRTGVMCKCRVDKLTQVHIWDLKTTQRLGKDFFRQFSKLDYLFSGAFYRRGGEVIDGIKRMVGVVAVESTEPHDCAAGPIDFAQMNDAEQRIDYYLDKVRECQESGVWPGTGNPENWVSSPWVNVIDDPEYQGNPEDEPQSGGGRW